MPFTEECDDSFDVHFNIQLLFIITFVAVVVVVVIIIVVDGLLLWQRKLFAALTQTMFDTLID